MFLIGANKYNSLTDEQKQWVDEAAEYACKEQRAFDKELNDQALETIKENGHLIRTGYLPRLHYLEIVDQYYCEVFK